ncbi:hypothetical protein G9A89_023465 [Geosiphon pyriformis]|nr:hypothetical protein G9A89_023465 [Geosiphon pyriformis]
MSASNLLGSRQKIGIILENYGLIISKRLNFDLTSDVNRNNTFFRWLVCAYLYNKTRYELTYVQEEEFLNIMREKFLTHDSCASAEKMSLSGGELSDLIGILPGFKRDAKTIAANLKSLANTIKTQDKTFVEQLLQNDTTEKMRKFLLNLNHIDEETVHVFLREVQIEFATLYPYWHSTFASLAKEHGIDQNFESLVQIINGGEEILPDWEIKDQMKPLRERWAKFLVGLVRNKTFNSAALINQQLRRESDPVSGANSGGYDITSEFPATSNFNLFDPSAGSNFAEGSTSQTEIQPLSLRKDLNFGDEPFPLSEFDADDTTANENPSNRASRTEKLLLDRYWLQGLYDDAEDHLVLHDEYEEFADGRAQNKYNEKGKQPEHSAENIERHRDNSLSPHNTELNSSAISTKSSQPKNLTEYKAAIFADQSLRLANLKATAGSSTQQKEGYSLNNREEINQREYEHQKISSPASKRRKGKGKEKEKAAPALKKKFVRPTIKISDSQLEKTTKKSRKPGSPPATGANDTTLSDPPLRGTRRSERLKLKKADLKMETIIMPPEISTTAPNTEPNLIESEASQMMKGKKRLTKTDKSQKKPPVKRQKKENVKTAGDGGSTSTAALGDYSSSISSPSLSTKKDDK